MGYRAEKPSMKLAMMSAQYEEPELNRNGRPHRVVSERKN
jgi:hypothetical protein